jgi:hypothetical protein
VWVSNSLWKEAPPVEILSIKALNPSHRLSSQLRRWATACAEPTVQGGSSKSVAPYGAFVFAGGAPEIANTNTKLGPNRLIIASRHRRPPPPQGRLNEFATSPWCHRRKSRWKPRPEASVTTYSCEPPPRPWHTASLPTPPMHRPSRTERLGLDDKIPLRAFRSELSI